MNTKTPCQWQNRRAHFTGTPYAECQTCLATCHYYEHADELTAGCKQIEANRPRKTTTQKRKNQ